MKNIRTLLIAASALVFINIAHAQTSTAPAASASATTALTTPPGLADANAPYSADPLVQKRQANSIAKSNYKERKNAAKKEMNAEKKDAESDMKSDKAEATEIRNKAMTAEPAPK